MTKLYQKAFTLIELLIVIALLGVLAVGLLAALDPFEQFKKGTDTGIRNLVSETHGAIIRYFSIKSNMPWCPNGPEGNPCSPDPTNETTGALSGNIMSTALTEIIAAGELKPDFKTLAGNNLQRVFVVGSQANASVTVCYRPLAKSNQKDPNTKFNNQGEEVSSGCKSQGGTNDCYWCVK